jgi:hypothetical protein
LALLVLRQAALAYNHNTREIVHIQGGRAVSSNRMPRLRRRATSRRRRARDINKL